MFGRWYTQSDRSKGFQAADIERCWVGPWDESLRSWGQPSDFRKMELLGRAQARHLREKVPEAACGGRLMIATLNATSVNVVEAAGL
jgi:hypothetical protein